MFRVAFIIAVNLACWSDAHSLKLGNYLSLEYQITNTSAPQSLQFEATAIAVTGWVGLGINEQRTDMIGAHIFVAGMASTGPYAYEAIGFRNGLPNWSPADESNPNREWNLEKAWEGPVAGVVSTKLSYWRPLKTPLLEIQDKDVHIIWAYNVDSDSVYNDMHTRAGNCTINFVTAESTCSGGSNVVGVSINLFVMVLILGKLSQ